MPVFESQKKPWTNFMVSDSAGRIYLSSKEPEEGYVKHEYKSPGSDTKSFVYRKYIDGVAGKITGLSFDNYGGTKIVMEDGKENLSIQIANPSNGLSRATKAFITVAYNADFNKDLYLSFYVKKTVKTFDDGSEKEYENIRAYLCYFDTILGQKLEERPPLMDITKIPAVETTEKKGKKSYDYTNQDRYYEELFAEMQQRVPEYVPNKSEINVVAEEKEVTNEDSASNDDLPF